MWGSNFVVVPSCNDQPKWNIWTKFIMAAVPTISKMSCVSRNPPAIILPCSVLAYCWCQNVILDRYFIKFLYKFLYRVIKLHAVLKRYWNLFYTFYLRWKRNSSSFHVKTYWQISKKQSFKKYCSRDKASQFSAL